MKQKSDRVLNGYKLIYLPDHHKAMTSKNWKGYVYEHIVIAEEEYGRKIKQGEEVHHLDCDKSNNKHSNLVIVDIKTHRKIHHWIKSSDAIVKAIDENRMNSKKPKLRCKVCNKPLMLKQKKTCSVKCHLKTTTSKLDGYCLNDILELLSKYSFVQTGKMLNISDNGLRKWLYTKHNFNKATLSEALSTLKERAETSGEVKSS